MLTIITHLTDKQLGDIGMRAMFQAFRKEFLLLADLREKPDHVVRKERQAEIRKSIITNHKLHSKAELLFKQQFDLDFEIGRLDGMRNRLLDRMSRRLKKFPDREKFRQDWVDFQRERLSFWTGRFREVLKGDLLEPIVESLTER